MGEPSVARPSLLEQPSIFSGIRSYIRKDDEADECTGGELFWIEPKVLRVPCIYLCCRMDGERSSVFRPPRSQLKRFAPTEDQLRPWLTDCQSLQSGLLRFWRFGRVHLSLFR